MTTLTRTAWGLEPDRGLDWLPRAACHGQWDLFDAETFAEQQQAAHLCNNHCGVLAECKRQARRSGRWYGVLAGMTAGWRTPRDPGCGPHCATARLSGCDLTLTAKDGTP